MEKGVSVESAKFVIWKFEEVWDRNQCTRPLMSGVLIHSAIKLLFHNWGIEFQASTGAAAMHGTLGFYGAATAHVVLPRPLRRIIRNNSPDAYYSATIVESQNSTAYKCTAWLYCRC